MTRDSRALAARWLAAAAAVLAVAVTVVGGMLVSGHSHVENFISELGAVGTPWGRAVSLGGFLPTGLVSLAFLVVAAPLVAPKGAAKMGYALLSSIGLAYVGAAFAPCDPGCPAFPTSVRQLVHNLLGILEYLGGGVGLLVFAGTNFRQRRDLMAQGILFVAGVVVLATFAGIADPTLGEWRGLIQRVGETALFGSLLLIGWRMARA
jgi:hypothetical protein